jgi:3-hydroxyisobutyrate dehydrogenase-like beta-hydroxyacid dehydrogenase
MDGERGDGPGIAFVGFGEAAQALLKGFGPSVSGPVTAYDVKSLDPAHAEAMASCYGAAGVAGGGDLAAALRGAGAIFCLVTADQALAAAEAAAPHLEQGTLWFDGNSCAPGTKRRAAEAIAGKGGRYVDLAIMAPVHPRLHQTPVLVSGPAAAAASAFLATLDMRPTVAGGRVGDASAIKMIRSVMVKGFEALTAECLLAARRAHVDPAVLASLQASDPGIDWVARGAYNFERMMVHGARRAAEMREVAATLRELGLPDRMAAATALWQEEIAALHLDAAEADLGDRADRILAALA